jgi:hypothetical protein
MSPRVEKSRRSDAVESSSNDDGRHCGATVGILAKNASRRSPNPKETSSSNSPRCSLCTAHDTQPRQGGLETQPGRCTFV